MLGPAEPSSVVLLGLQGYTQQYLRDQVASGIKLRSGICWACTLNLYHNLALETSFNIFFCQPTRYSFWEETYLQGLLIGLCSRITLGGWGNGVCKQCQDLTQVLTCARHTSYSLGYSFYPLVTIWGNLKRRDIKSPALTISEPVLLVSTLHLGLSMNMFLELNWKAENVLN